MANTFASSEKTLDKVDPKASAHVEGGVVTAAQDAYKVGGGGKIHETKSASAQQELEHSGSLEIKPLWHKGPEQNVSPDEQVRDARKIAPLTEIQKNSNAMRSSEDAPLHEFQRNSNAMNGTEMPQKKSGWDAYEALDDKGKPAKKAHEHEPVSNTNAEWNSKGKGLEKSPWDAYEALNLEIKKRPVDATEHK